MGDGKVQHICVPASKRAQGSCGCMSWLPGKLVAGTALQRDGVRHAQRTNVGELEAGQL